MADEISRDLGAHEARIDIAEARIERMEAKIDSILAKLQQTEGAWKMLLGVSAFSSALTALAFKFWGILKGGA